MIPQSDGFSRKGRRPEWMRNLALAPLAAGAILLSAFFFTAVIALFLIAIIGFSLRTWWLRRRLRATASQTAVDSRQPLEGEYVVVKEEDSVTERR